MPDPLLDGDPARIGPYTLHARLGGGGMGQVFLGHSPGGHTVAVKVVRPDLAQDPDFRRRFAAEVAAARKVGGFYTAQVVDADPGATPPWLATAYIPGPTLHRAVTDHGPLPAGSVAVLGAGLAEGLAAVHAQGVVHRDLKPGNVLLAADGPRVIDFGIARAMDSPSYSVAQPVMGTIGFMSPEQARGEEVAPPSDVFSLGCVLAFAATGRSPFGEGAIHAVIFRVVHEEPDLTGVPEPLASLVGACLAKDPASRPRVEEVLAALAAEAPPPSRSDGSWLPEAVTEVLVRHTLAYTRVQEQRTPPPAAETGVDAQPPPTPNRDPAEPSGAELVIGNLSTHPMDVVVDDTLLGTVPRFASGAFPVAPGQRSLLVRAQGRGEARRITVAEGSAAKLAFELSSGPNAAPVLVEKVVFIGSELPRMARSALVGGVLAFILGWPLAAVLSATGVLPNMAFPEEAPSLIFLATLIGCVLGPMFGSRGRPVLVLSTQGLTPVALNPRLKGQFNWDYWEQVSMVGEGRHAQFVAWPRGVWSPMIGGKELLGGKVVCRAGEIRAGEPLQNERLRAALRWFADDLWVEQPTNL